jgi:hypothetical protein
MPNGVEPPETGAYLIQAFSWNLKKKETPRKGLGNIPINKPQPGINPKENWNDGQCVEYWLHCQREGEYDAE